MRSNLHNFHFLFADASGLPIGPNEFIFAPFPNYNSDYDNIGVIIQATTNYETIVNIEVPLRSLEYNLILPAGSGPQIMGLPLDLISRVADLVDNTVHITADSNISVVTYNGGVFSAGAYSLVPATLLGQEYFVATYIDNDEGNVSRGVIIISAWTKTTDVEIHLTSYVEYKGITYYSGDVIYETLDPFQSLQLLPTDIAITGTRIYASNPVAVSTGNMCTDVPHDVDACDHISEQLVPFDKWGMSFTLSPFHGRSSGYLFQIVAGRDDTSVSIGDSSLIYLNEGQFHTVDVVSQEMTQVTSDKPVLVMQYVKGSNADGVATDPAMNRVIPNEQFVRQATFPVYKLFPANSQVAVTTECESFDSLVVYENNLLVQVRLNGDDTDEFHINNMFS